VEASNGVEVLQRLLLWARREGRGLARVEYSSEFARLRLEQRLQAALAEVGVAFTVVTLPPLQSATEVMEALLEQLGQVSGGVVSVTGFATAFDSQTPLKDALRVLNFNREAIAAFHLRQIWWMTPVVLQTAIHAMPDLQGWFSPQLVLNEIVFEDRPDRLALLSDGQSSWANLEDAYRRTRQLLEQFAVAQAAGAAANDLLMTYLLPALENLAEVGAQKELRDLTSQFEGLLGSLKIINSPEMAIGMVRLADLYESQGRYSEAEPLYVRSLSIREQQLGADHPDVATSLNNLAELYRSQGRYSEAEPLYGRSLSIWEQQLGADHPDVATSLNNLAGLYDSQGRYSEAEPLYGRSLSIREQQLGADHPDVASSLNNLALLYTSQGRYGEAEPLYERSLFIKEQQLGANHPDVATSLNNLAELYRSQGRYSEAEPLYVRSLSIREQQLGADHPDVAISLNNLALFYTSQGRYSEAEPLYVRSISIFEKVLPANHPNLAIVRGNLELVRQQMN
jgi:tetratricopeptide (TPR) repeat protein